MAKKKRKNKKKSIRHSTKKRVVQISDAERAFRFFRVAVSEDEMHEPGEEIVPDDKRDAHDAIHGRLVGLMKGDSDPGIIADIESIIDEFPSLSYPRNWLIIVHQLNGNLDHALELAEVLQSERPDYFFSRINVAQIHYELGNYEKAGAALWSSGYSPSKAYPDRDVFHGSEVYSWLLNSGKILAVTGELEAANYCKDILSQTSRGIDAAKNIGHLIEEQRIRIFAEKNGISLPPSV